MELEPLAALEGLSKDVDGTPGCDQQVPNRRFAVYTPLDTLDVFKAVHLTGSTPPSPPGAFRDFGQFSGDWHFSHQM